MFDLSDGEYHYIGDYYDSCYFVRQTSNWQLLFGEAQSYDYDARRDCAWDYVDTKQLRIDAVNHDWYEYSLESFEEDMDVMDYYSFYDNHECPPDEVMDAIEELWYDSDDYEWDFNYPSDTAMRQRIPQMLDRSNNNDYKDILERILTKLGREKIQFLPTLEPIR